MGVYFLFIIMYWILLELWNHYYLQNEMSALVRALKQKLEFQLALVKMHLAQLKKNHFEEKHVKLKTCKWNKKKQFDLSSVLKLAQSQI